VETIVKRQDLQKARRIIIKIGSALLADTEPYPFERFSWQIRKLTESGRQIILVSSGAIALGLAPMGLTHKPKSLSMLQAAAAAGQGILMSRWQYAFSRYQLHPAQVLLTHEDFKARRRYLNARSTLMELLNAGVVPVINENDTVSVDEIKFGDNDALAALVGGLVEADLLIILTQTDGLFTADPRQNPEASRISQVDEITPEIMNLGGGASHLGTGGMITKLQAARNAREQGIATLIAPGRIEHILDRLFQLEDWGTFFAAKPYEQTISARKRWIAYALKPGGRIMVDPGARKALQKGSSLLVAGTRGVQGIFLPGDAVDLYTENSTTPFARGLVRLSAQQLQAVLGCKTEKARKILNEPIPDELIHRDDLILLEPEELK